MADSSSVQDVIVLPPSDEQQDTRTAIEKTDVPREEKIDKYLLFKQQELEDYQTRINDKMDSLAVEIASRGGQTDRDWRMEKSRSLASQEGDKMYSKTGDVKWKYLSELMMEFMWDVYGIGDLLRQEHISEIYIDGHNIMYIQLRDGTLQRLPQRFETPEHYLKNVSNWVKALARNNERFDISHPEVNLTLPNGDRFHAIGYLCEEPFVTIRKHTYDITSLDKLVEMGSLSAQMSNFLAAAVKGEMNCLIAGSTGSGKTTLMRCMLFEIEKEELVIIIEDTQEIAAKRFAKFRARELRSREANIEGEGAVHMEDLIRSSLRMNPDRVIVGEVRGAEATPMLLSMSQGNDGSLATIHADSAANAITRLQNYMRLYGQGKNMTEETTSAVIRESLHLIIFQKRAKNNRPALHEIVAIDNKVSGEKGQPLVHNVGRWDDEKQECVPVPVQLPAKIMAQLKAGGWRGWSYELD